ncbi:hypothetical protein A2U01_0108478, partial [Trifolium medium]|nr:hypothetical protein [Trifolium medium]
MESAARGGRGLSQTMGSLTLLAWQRAFLLTVAQPFSFGK